MTLLWKDFTFDHKGELFTVTWKVRLKRWEILSSKRWVVDPKVIPDEPANATEERAKELISKL